MEFKFNSNIFKNSVEDQKRLYKDNYDPSKPYPGFTGTALVTEEQIRELAEYFHWALKTDLKFDEYLGGLAVPIKISGWQKESEKTGKKFLSLSYAPDYKTMMAAKEAKESSVDNSAEDLAKATNGTVIKTEEQEEQADIF